MPDLIGKKITSKEFDGLSSGFELDLIAYYKQLEEDSMKLLNEAVREGWTPDKLIKQYDKLMG